MSARFDAAADADELERLLRALHAGDDDPATLRRVVVIMGELMNVLATAVAGLIRELPDRSRGAP